MTDFPTTRTEGLQCPFCEAPNDAVTQTAGDMTGVPDDGSVLLCAYCLQPGILDSSVIRRPTDQELVELASDQGYLDSVRALTSMGGFGS